MTPNSFVPDNVQQNESTGVPSSFVPESYPGSAAESAPDTAVQPHSSGGPIPTFFPATGNEAAPEAGAKVLGNLLPSAGNFAAGAVEAPFKILGDITKIPSAVSQDIKENGVMGGLNKAGSQFAEYMYNNFLPDIAKRGVEYAAGSIGKEVKKNPELVQAFQKMGENNPKANIPGIGETPEQLTENARTGALQNIEENPVGNIAPFVMAARGAAYAHSPEVGAAFDQGVSKVASPVTAASDALGSFIGKGANAVGGFGRWGASQLTGLDADTIKQVIDNPEDFSHEKVASASRVDLAQSIKDAIDDRQGKLNESGTGYSGIRNPPSMIDVGSDRPGTATDFESMIQKNTGLTLGEDGKWNSTATSRVDSPTDIAKIQRLYEAWKPYFEQGQMTQNEFLTLRGKLATIANYEGIGKSTPLENAAAGMRSDLNTNYRSQVPGLEDLDADFASQKTELDKLSKGLLDREGNLRDSDINKIANATGKAKTQLLKQLEELSPGISDRISALKAMEDIRDTVGKHKVGTYTSAAAKGGALAGGAAIAISSGSLLPLVAGITEAVLTSPKVAVPLLRAYGYSKNITAGVMGNLGQIASGINNLPNQSLPMNLGAFSPTLTAGKSGGTQ